MKHLLLTEVADEINRRRPGNLKNPFPNIVEVGHEDINKAEFDIADIKNTGGCIQRPLHQGEATYINCPQDPYLLRFIKFEEYMNQFNISQGDWAKGLSRTDFLVHTLETSAYLIFHELSQGKVSSKESKAKQQILNSLRFMHNIPEVRKYMSSFEHRLGILSAKGCADIESPRGVGEAFMEAYSVLPDPKPIKNQSVERMGFKMYATNIVELQR